MDINKPMPILLIEDDTLECELFKSCVISRDDVRLVATTNSSTEGIKNVKAYMPEGIIVDLELHKGEGSGLDFLSNLKNLDLDFKPLIIVTTNVSSEAIYDFAHENGADLIFYKKQKDYLPEVVINSMLLLRKTLYSSKSKIKQDLLTTETLEEYRARVSQKINSELDLVGIGSHLKGRKYLFDAIYYLLEIDDKDKNESVFQYLVNTYKRANSSISRAMQTAINHAWRISPIEDLEVHYTARISYETGVPTPTEFIYYYKEKIKKFI